MSGSPHSPPAAEPPISWEEAARIGRHYFGERLATVEQLVAPRWEVEVFGNDGKAFIFRPKNDATLIVLCEHFAAQLRAAGWTPTHARLEWEDGDLRLCIDAHAQTLFTTQEHWETGRDGEHLYHLYDHVTNEGARALHECPLSEVVEYIAEWCAAHLPSLHLPLPPFPETPSAHS